MEVYVPCWRFIEWHWEWTDIRSAAAGLALVREWGATYVECRRRTPTYFVHPGWLRTERTASSGNDEAAQGRKIDERHFDCSTGFGLPGRGWV